MASNTRSIALALAIGVTLGGCIVRRFTTPQLTGTCDGACSHYAECKPGHSDADRARCTTECPEVFRDPDSLMGYESLSCKDAVEYIDGAPNQAGPPKRG